MQKSSTSARRGFTLVEFMIALSVVSMLAAVAVYGVRRYVASSRTGEAKASVDEITRGAVAAFERDIQVGMPVSAGTPPIHALCATTSMVPDTLAEVAARPYRANGAPGSDYQTPAWSCIRFSRSEPQYYQYQYVAPASTVMDARAVGDLDGDGTPSVFSRTGIVNPTSMTLRLATQIAIVDELE